MKFSCCPFIAVLVLIVLVLQIWIIRALPARQATSTPSPSTPATSLTPASPTPSPAPTSTPTSDSTLLFKRDNPGACSFTANSPFSLKEAHQITKLQTWYSWGSNEITLDYALKQNGITIREGVLTRKDCDPYQRQWCQAVEENLNIKLEPGDYTLIADTSKICQNSTSGGDGFIFVYGK